MPTAVLVAWIITIVCIRHIRIEREGSRGMITTTRLTALMVIISTTRRAVIALTSLRHRRTTIPIPVTKVLVFVLCGIHSDEEESR